MVAIPPKKNQSDARSADRTTPREAELQAQVAKLKSRNNRLGRAMLSLVSHIEHKLPFLGAKAPVLVPPASTERSVSAPLTATSHTRETGQSWKPAVLVQEKAGDVLLRKRADIVAAKLSMDLQSAETEAIIFGDTAPALKPHEIDILKSPTQNRPQPEKLAEPTAAKNDDSEATVAREAKKTSAQQAADAYEAVAVVSTPVPDDVPGDIVKQDDNPYRVAMRKRVNRLRW